MIIFTARGETEDKVKGLVLSISALLSLGTLLYAAYQGGMIFH